MPVNAGDTRSGTAPLESAPATRCASCLTIGAGNAMPRRVSSSPPTIAATSFADSTTESGPARRSRRSTFVWLLASALGVGAPTAVSATGGSLVGRGPNQRAPVRRIGSRNPHATSPAATRRRKPPSRTIPLKQPLTVPDLIHRASRLERALHQVHRFHERRLPEAQPGERAFQAPEVARPAPPRA